MKQVSLLLKKTFISYTVINFDQGINDDISLVKMPPAMRKRGRPKGAGLTVIGLPAKKKGKSANVSKVTSCENVRMGKN